MHDARLFQKIAAPPLPSVLLHRTALVTRLREAIVPETHQERSNARYKLVLCCAPAGYGKTTLLADFARSTSLPCCWYFLDNADTDAVVFLHMLVASLQQVFPHFKVSLDPFLHDSLTRSIPPTSEAYQPAVDALCDALEAEISERFAIILCNYEEVSASQTLNELINFLLKKLPPQVTLIIESRVMPNLSLASLLVRDEMCGFSSDILRFSAHDIKELAGLQGLTTLTDAEAEHLAISFEGWIAGILLGTRLGDARAFLPPQEVSTGPGLPFHQMTSSAVHKRQQLFCYVVNEALKLDSVGYTFLQTASILQLIEPDLCDILLGITDAAERLAQLEYQGWFITSYESASERIYTCHPVIRDLLRERFQKLEPERFLALHRQAAKYWSRRQNYEQAMYHASEGRDYDLQVQLIIEAHQDLLHRGQLETLARWLHALPSTVQETSPQLLLIQATIELARGQYTAAFPLLDKVSVSLSCLDEAEEKTLLLQVEMEILRGRAFYQAGNYAQAQFFCHQALLHLPEKEKTLRATAQMHLGICANLQGNFSLGITHLQQARALWDRVLPLKQAGDISSALANTYYLSGNFVLAQHYLIRALDIYEQIQDDEGKVNTLLLQGMISQKQGASPEAEETLLRALELARASRYSRRGEAYALANLGSLYLEQGKYTQALMYTEQGLVLARTFGNRSLINTTLANLSLIHLFLGDPASALQVVEQMEGPAIEQKTLGYERIWHDLTYGMILLTQGRFSEAAACLSEIEAAVTTTDLQQGIFQVKLRLATCYIAQHRQKEAVRLLEEVTSRLSAQRNYTHLVQIELQWLPALLSVVQTHPQLAPLRHFLGMVEVPQLQNEPPSNSVVATVNVPKLTIFAFGDPSVLIDEEPIKRWRKAKAMELFFFLLNRNHPVSKETILTALWPEGDEQTTQTFHSALHYLRKLLGEPCVVFGGGTYSLSLAACYGEQVWYDVEAFRQYRLEADHALDLQSEAGAKEALLKMVQLYRGDYGRPFDCAWCTFERDELRTAYLEARRRLAQMAWHAEAWNESAEHFRSMLYVDNCLEEAHYGLMRCYVRQGRRSVALRQYRVCQEVFQEELGVAPSQVLQNFYHHLIEK